MPIQYIQGDLFEALKAVNDNEVIWVPHVVNNCDRFGAGFAKAVNEFSPVPKQTYHEWFDGYAKTPDKGRNYSLGQLQFAWASNNIRFINMVAQDGLPSKTNPHPLKYLSLAQCMNAVRNVLQIKIINEDQYTHKIYCPLFGTGLARGSWAAIREFIRELWDEFDVSIFHLSENAHVIDELEQITPSAATLRQWAKEVDLSDMLDEEEPKPW